MPELFPNEFPSQSSSDIWGFDPVQVMMLLFIIVPIGIAVLVLTFGTLGRLLSGSRSSESIATTAKKRFDVSRRLQTETNLVGRRLMASRLNDSAVCPFHRRHRLTIRQTRECRPQRRVRKWRS
jgi:hypothetical protein